MSPPPVPYDALPGKLNNHFQELWLQFKQAVRNYQRSYGRDAIHDLRLAVKRLRLIYELSEHCATVLTALPDFTSIHRLFRKAGQIRDIHVQMGLINRWKAIGNNHLHELANECKRSERKRRARFLRICADFPDRYFKKTERKVAAGFLSLTEPALREAILGTFLLHYSRLLAFPRNGDRHRLRIRVKSTRHAIELLAICRPRWKAAAKLDRFLQRIQKPLGRWHDIQVGLRLTERCLMQAVQLTLPDTAEYRRYQRYLRGQLRIQLKEFNGIWKAFLTDPLARAFRKQGKT